MESAPFVPKVKSLTFARAALMYFGFLGAAALWLSSYVLMRGPANMGPFIVFVAPFVSVPLMGLALGVDRLLFFRSRAFKWTVSWFLLGLAYGSFWSFYPLAFFVSPPYHSFSAAAAIAIALALLVRVGDHCLSRCVEI